MWLFRYLISNNNIFEHVFIIISKLNKINKLNEINEENHCITER